MLKITADVNGRVIGRVCIHNTGWGNELYVAEYDAATIGEDGEVDIMGIEGVMHRRGDGWKKLAAIVLRRADGIRNHGK